MDGVLKTISNESFLTIVAVVWGLVVKYHPAFAKWPNRFIPYMNLALALLTHVAVPEAHAAGGALSSAGGFATSLLASVWTSTKAALVYEIFLRSHINLPVPRE